MTNFYRLVPVAFSAAALLAGGISAGENGFSMAMGGGLDWPIRRRFSIRLIQAEYLLTRFDRLAAKHRRKRGDLARIVLEDWVAEQEKAEKNEKQKK